VSQHPVPLIYGDVRLERTYRLDFFIEGLVIVELKAIECLGPIHRAQMLTYLRLTSCPVGLVLNFCAPVMREGIMRVVNNFPDLEGAGNEG
jgi:GxxExxY protein